MAAQNKLYSDLDLNFVNHPLTGNLRVIYSSEAVKQSIKVLVLTQFFERFHAPYKGSNVKYYLFENLDSMGAMLVREEILRVVRTYEPRVTNVEVVINVSEDQNGFDCTITAEIINIKIPVTVELFLERTR